MKDDRNPAHLKLADEARDAARAARGIARHALVATDGNDRGVYRASCRCGVSEYGPTPERARDKLAAHVNRSNP